MGQPTSEELLELRDLPLRDEAQAAAIGVNVREEGGIVAEDIVKGAIDSRFAVLLTAMIALIGISIGANFTFLQMYLPTH